MTDIRRLFDRYKTAVFEKNIDAFLSIFDTDVQVFDMWGAWCHQGLGAWREMTLVWLTRPRARDRRI